MHKHFIVATSLFVPLVAGPATARAQSRAEFEALKKKVAALEERLGERPSTADAPALDAAKLKLTESLTELKLSGDLRLRYQYDNKDNQVDPVGEGNDEDRSANSNQRSRYRFRLRLNADFKLGENFFGGVQLVTGQENDSDNQTLENGFNDYDIFISRAYLGWHAADWLTVVAGKQPNPFYVTELTWDADINPTGVSESIQLHKLFARGAADEKLAADGKTILNKSVESPWELSLNLGQFIFDDNNEGNFDNDAADDAYLFVGQLVATWNLGKDVKLSFAPGYMFFNAADVSGVLNANSFSDAPDVSGETRKLSFITAPGDLTFKLGKVPAKFYWDFSYNTDGKGRVDDIYRVVATRADGSIRSKHSSVDDFAYLVGVQLGQNKKPGDWSLLANWRQSGIAGVDPNLNDSDFALSELNTRGFKLVATYSFTSFFTGGVSYAHAWNLRDDLFGGQATSGTAFADGNVIDVFQVDFNLKF
jgi:hypothetical protein